MTKMNRMSERIDKRDEEEGKKCEMTK